jgi:hypothetical protein
MCNHTLPLTTSNNSLQRGEPPKLIQVHTEEVHWFDPSIATSVNAVTN